MIEFACHCGERFSVPADQAGTQLQCPKCFLLIDVPTMSELASLRQDGTYIMDQTRIDPALAQSRFNEYVEAFSKDTYDQDGFEKDLRLKEGDLEGVSIPTVDGSGRNRIAPPKYDPVTGELIRPMDLAPVAVQPVKALPKVYQGPVLGYAANVPTAQELGWKHVWLALFTAPNMVVMLFAFFCHIIMQLCLVMLGLLFPIGIFFVLGIMLVAHYGAVVISIGADDRDELPRPLGNLSLSEDIWTPFYNLFAALMLCYLPAAATFYRLGWTPEGVFFTGSLAALGTVFFPAVLLTLATSGTVLNLRPDRLLGLIRVSGGYYIASVIEWLVVLPLYGGSIAGLYIVGGKAFQGGGGGIRMLWLLPVMGGLIASIYLTHLFLWHLGLLYRGKGAAFPWVFQYQVRTPKPAVEDPKNRRAKARRKFMGQE